MTDNEKTLPYTLYQRSMVKLNSLFDRIIQLSDMVLEDGYQLPWSKAQGGLKRIARFVGNMSWLLKDFPRLSAYKLSGPDWTIVFVGSEHSLGEIHHLFFADEKVAAQELGRVALWQLSAQCQGWWAEGVDLVVSELSYMYPFQLQAPFSFRVPGWIRQVLELPDNLESLLAGGQMEKLRSNLKRAQKANFSWYYSQAREDFDYFYHSMYLPYVKERHGSRAVITPYEVQRRRWFMRGGLLVVTQNNTRVAGGLCYISDKTCFGIEMGVLDCNPDLLKHIKIIFDWFNINWAHQQGARMFDMGTTRAWRSDGVFFTKSRWQANVARRRRVYGVWTFLAQDMPVTLQQHINQIGFISEVKGKFYAALLDTAQLPLSSSEIDRQLSMAQKEGLDGLLVVSANRHQVIPAANSTVE